MNEVWNLLLIGILGWDNSYRTSIEISLPIILHIHFI